MTFTVGHHRFDPYGYSNAAQRAADTMDELVRRIEGEPMKLIRHKRLDPPDRATPEPILEALVCPNCGDDMDAEHAHHKCPECGYLEPCCQGEPQ